MVILASITQRQGHKIMILPVKLQKSTYYSKETVLTIEAQSY
ncbi:MAG: hypothetical protein NWE98_05905 [Candidatus Bathyarchaeota archaeon]|nr:hypothetical protein [Candidatus Bathyarchaeota archaeon]